MKRFCLSLCVVFIFATAYVQNTIPQAQTLFIYDFSALIEWPQDYQNGPFIIGVIGESQIYEELKNYTAAKNVHSQNIQVVQFNSEEEISKCHILFVPFSKTRLIPKINKSLAGQSTLLITEKNGALSAGSAINFVIVHEKIKFEVNAENAYKCGLRLSPELKEMAYLSK